MHDWRKAEFWHKEKRLTRAEAMDVMLDGNYVMARIVRPHDKKIQWFRVTFDGSREYPDMAEIYEERREKLWAKLLP